MLRVRDIMTKDVVTVEPETTLREAMELFAARHVSGAPVVAGAEVVGVVSASDLLSFAATASGDPALQPARGDEVDGEEPRDWERAAEPSAVYFSDIWEDVGAELPERFRDVEGPEWNVLEGHTVAEVMSRCVYSLPANAEAAKAADYMRRAGVHRIVILDRGRLIGIVSTMDVVRAVAERHLPLPAQMFESLERL